MYDTTSNKSSLWVNHGKICDFACRLPLKPSTLNLFNGVDHFDDTSDFNGYIESAEMCNYYKSIPSGLIAARMSYLCEKYKIPKRSDGSTRIHYPEVEVSFTLRWQHERSSHWIN